jgi:hypothetical protein
VLWFIVIDGACALVLVRLDLFAMTSLSMHRFIVNVSFRTAGRRANCNSRISRWEAGSFKQTESRRHFSSGEHEQVPFHPTAVHVPEARKYEQRRPISTAELDKYRDMRERIVILGSGWAGYTLSKEIDHKKYQVVIVSYLWYETVISS